MLEFLARVRSERRTDSGRAANHVRQRPRLLNPLHHPLLPAMKSGTQCCATDDAKKQKGALKQTRSADVEVAGRPQPRYKC